MVERDFTDAVRCVPQPAWVEHHPWPAEEGQSHDSYSDNGLLRVLYDVQVSLLQPGVAWHLRAVQRILTRSGAERAAHVAIEFDPASDRLEVHYIRVWRGDDCIEHARPSEFQILRRETQLERLALDGRLTATLLIPDLRVDDRLETAFTLYSANPTLSGRYAAWNAFKSAAPWIETRQRLIHPLERRVFFKAFNEPPATRSDIHDGIKELSWSILGQRRVFVENLLPPWYLRYPCYQITEFEHWSEVASVFEGFYRDVILPSELIKELDELAVQHTAEAERAVEWLRTVQTKLRYFALALGEGGLVPRSLEQIWAKRFGDCKDAARLYVAGARYLGLDACAALVSTTSGENFSEYLPSPQLFNHVVVRVRLGGGATYWLDPTLQLQGGPLEQMALSYASWALPLTVGTTELERLPGLQPVQHIRCEDSLKLGPNVNSPAVLERRIDFGFWTADALRNRLEGDGTSRLAAQLLQEQKRIWPDVVEHAPLQIQDDFLNNRLSVLCSFEIRGCWKRNDRDARVLFEIADPFLGNELAPLDDLRRIGEIFVGRPRKATWRATLQMPREWQGTGWNQALSESGIQFRSDLRISGATVVAERELEIVAPTVAAMKAQGYSQIVEKLRQNVITLWATAGSDGTFRPINTVQPQRKFPVPWLALLFLPALIGGLSALNSASHPTFIETGFLPQPEVHVNRFNRLVDSSLERCINTGRDAVAAFVHSTCLQAAKVRLLRPSGGDPYEVVVAPGAKSYVYFMEPSDTSGGMAACPAADQIVEATTGLSWRFRGTSYTCQHSLN